ncbi:MAG: poly-gamma-glutamate system protein [Sandaracinaceae bacterium]
MKAMYWRRNSISTPQLVIVAVLAAAMLFTVEGNPGEERGAQFEVKMRAARLAEEMLRAINLERIRLQVPLDTEVDPAGSGLIGPPRSLIVSNEGHLSSKQTSVNPNFAAVFVDMLEEADVSDGDVVAVNCTGSFPAMNLNLYAALEAVGAEPIVVSSVAASEYGATHESLTWLDMERVLFERDLVSFRSSAASMGGVLDVARNHSPEGQEAIRSAIERNDRALLYPQGYEQAVEMRLALFEEERRGRPIALFVNVGGGTASVGTADDKHDFRPGLNTRAPHGLDRESVMRHFLESDVPVIHVTQIRSLARRYGLEDRPMETPSPGEGSVFRVRTINRWLLVGVLALILVLLFAATRFDFGTAFSRKKAASEGAEPMV